MANEQRLIDAKDFDLRVSQRSMTELFPNWNELPEAVKDMLCEHGQYLHMLLETQPTVDAEPVVRCKYCKFSVINSIYDPMECVKWRTKWGVCYTNPEGYCHKGERI